MNLTLTFSSTLSSVLLGTHNNGKQLVMALRVLARNVLRGRRRKNNFFSNFVLISDLGFELGPYV